MQRITLADTPAADIVIRDADGLGRKYRLKTPVRSLKLAFNEKRAELADLYNEAPDDAEPDERLERRIIRGVCDCISVLLEGGRDDTPDAGNVLYDGWLNDRVTEDQIYRLFNDLTKVGADPN